MIPGVYVRVRTDSGSAHGRKARKPLVVVKLVLVDCLTY